MHRLAGLVVVALFVVGASPAAAQTQEVFTSPPGLRVGAGLAVAPDGTVWFGGTSADNTVELARLKPAEAAPGTANGITRYPLAHNGSCCASQMRDMALDPVTGRVWFARSDGMVGYGDPAALQANTPLTGQTTANVPSSFVDLGGIALTPSGDAWFTEYGVDNFNAMGYPGNRVATATPSLGITELPNITRYDAKPRQILVAADGAVWFVQAEAGNPGRRIARVDGQAYTEYTIPADATNGTALWGIAEAPDGAIWATNERDDTLLRLDPGSAQVKTFALSAIDPTLTPGRPTRLRRAVDGTLWFTVLGGIGAPGANALVRIVPSAPAPSSTVYQLGVGRAPVAMAPDTKGNVWFAATDQGQVDVVGRLAGVVGPPPGSGGPPPVDPGQGTMPPPSTSPPATAPPITKPLVVASTGVAKVGKPTVLEDSVNLNQICVGPPQDKCSLVYLINEREYVTGFPGVKPRAGAAAKKKLKITTIARKTLTLQGGQSKKVKIRLNAKGRTSLKRKGRVTATLVVTQKGVDGKVKTIKRVTLKFKAAKKGR